MSPWEMPSRFEHDVHQRNGTSRFGDEIQENDERTRRMVSTKLSGKQFFFHMEPNLDYFATTKQHVPPSNDVKEKKTSRRNAIALIAHTNHINVKVILAKFNSYVLFHIMVSWCYFFFFVPCPTRHRIVCICALFTTFQPLSFSSFIVIAMDHKKKIITITPHIMQ